MADKKKPNRFMSTEMRIIKAKTPNFYRQRELWLGEFLKDFLSISANPVDKTIHYKSNLDRLSLSKARLERLVLIDCDAANIRLEACEIEQLVLIRSNIQNANLSGSSIQMAVMVEVIATNADFSNASLENSWLEGDFSSCNFSHAKLYQAVLKGNFQNVSFRDANCEDVWLRETKLQGANFTDAVVLGMTSDLAQPFGAILPDGTPHNSTITGFYQFTRKPKRVTNNE